MPTCLSCGQDNPAGARFCNACAAPLDAEPRRPHEERKIVTCLFCDLVGFTARAERMDPEEVRRLLQPYHARVRSELERHGGTVEKFIGDAVMAVFGAPTAHEDDPERAVRAALAIRGTLAAEGEREIRIGITTGEALIALDARLEAGEGIASGDVVNTASRLQTVAPVGGILVDETTYRATDRAIEYRDSVPVLAKGKAEPVPAWQALRSRPRVSVDRPSVAPLVGRSHELAILRDTVARVTREREPQLVTLVGVPGIGKSRLVFELSRALDRDPDPFYWRLGRSLPYGDGVTFWALGEIVKRHAGILESDLPEQAKQKLRAAVTAVISERTDAAWIERHLRTLAGVETEDAGTGDRRSEAFAAWRRFLEAIAEQRPLVLVFEDLHWADEALLDFVDHLVDRGRGVPILVLATSRPELLARRPGWGGGKVNTATILLSPLSAEETAALVTSLLGSSALAPEGHEELLERAGGNPLYAEEFVRVLTDRRGELTLPRSVHGIIAARLDALPREEKDLLQDGAVIGSAFWLGALGGEGWAVEERALALARKEFLRPERQSSVAGDVEYTFRHALIREVAYEQIPKSRRADKHRAAAEWIESLGRPEDHAEMLAHHYLTAFEYAQAAGEPTDELAARALHALREAGDRALSLNAHAAAVRFYERAIAMVPGQGGDDRLRCDLLLRLGEAQARAGDTATSKQTHREAARLAATLQLPEQLAWAALGYGGRLIWDASRDDEDLVSLLESALSAIGGEDSIPRVKLLARLAGGPLRDAQFPQQRRALVSREALEMARRIGDPATLVYAIDAYIPANESPENTRELLELSTELLGIALDAGEKERVLEAHEHRVNRLVELGQMDEARSELEAMAGLAKELRQPGHEWLVGVHQGRLALLEGRFAEAEGLTVEALNVGTRAQNWYARVAFNLQLYVLRREQGRLGEVEELVRRSAEEYPSFPVWRCIAALTSAELGLGTELREFTALARDNFAEVPFDDQWLASMSFLAETAKHLGSTEEVAILYGLLLPYADRVAVTYPEISTGSVSRYLGILASTTARWDDAARHFEGALQMNRDIGARPWLAHTKCDYAAMLLRRAEPGDRERADDLLAAAKRLASESGMHRLSERVTGLMTSAAAVRESVAER